MDENEKKERIDRISKKLRINNLDELSSEENHIAEYLTPSPMCELCTGKLATKINSDYIENSENMTMKDFLNKHKTEFKEVIKRELTLETLRLHFSHHFNAKGAAAKRYNDMVKKQEDQKRFVPDVTSESNLPPSLITPELKELFLLLEDQHLNELKVLNYTFKAQLEHLKELKEIKIKRKNQDGNLNIENLIMKEADIIKNIQNVLLNKIKTFQTSKLQEAQTNALENISILNAQAMGSLGLETANPALIKRSQHLFVNTVIKHFLERLKKSLNTLKISNEEKAVFYADLKKQLQGVEKNIYTEFEENVKDINIIDAEVVE